jgi:hypothetical protein
LAGSGFGEVSQGKAKTDILEIMESKNARFLRASVVDRCRKMTPAERLMAYVRQLRMVRRIHLAGIANRKAAARHKKKSG